jgi:Ca2+-dependent lipid-binding protein
MFRFLRAMGKVPGALAAVIHLTQANEVTSTMGTLAVDIVYKAIQKRDPTFARQCLDILATYDDETLGALNDTAVSTVRSQLESDAKRVEVFNEVFN